VLDPERGAVALAANLPGWGRQGLVEALRRELGTNLSFENDVNLAAIGERARGHGQDVESFVYLWVGTGVGMGLVLNGELYRGSHGAAGEIAYLPVGLGDPKDPTNRRRGSFEEFAAAAGIARAAQELGMRAPLTPKKVFAAARRGHPAAMRAVEIEASRLALGIAAIAPVVDPALVILGGGVGHNGDLLLEPIQRELAAISPFHPPVVVSALGEEAVLQGAIATALDAARDRLFSRSQTA
jgi:predicted NBD/HSP70 family sugar kinase